MNHLNSKETSDLNKNIATQNITLCIWFGIYCLSMLLINPIQFAVKDALVPLPVLTMDVFYLFTVTANNKKVYALSNSQQISNFII